MSYPSVYPTGTTIYNPEKCWNGYTLFPAKQKGATLIDMMGNVVKLWEGLQGFPNKLLPGGQVFGSSGVRNSAYGHQDQFDLLQVDWDGNVVWGFDKYEYIEDPGEAPRWMARQHHDFQREGNPVGYYVPDMDPLVDKGTTLIVCHKNVMKPEISKTLLMDDTVIEIDWEGNILWEWACSDHFDELGFDEAALKVLFENPNPKGGAKTGDWMHMNSLSLLGPNKWFDQGDERFHPNNLIWDGRQTNIIAITDRKSGRIVWKVGPDYQATPELRALGQIVGQHHAHMIPRGLPGEGNILVFDNGGYAGYGAPNPGSVNGLNYALRDHSRVLEIDPTTLRIVWQYTPSEAGFIQPWDGSRFYSPFISSAQRLPNGNTMITEGSDGRIFEVTRDHELVWEYISPFFGTIPGMGLNQQINMVYRAYRVPYEWVPQLETPNESAIGRLDNIKFRVPGSPLNELQNVTKIKIG